jgi:hypothetical protein
MAKHNHKTEPNSKFDGFMTPEHVWNDVAPYIPKGKKISMPFWGDGRCAIYLKKHGFEIIHHNEDFFQHDRGEIIVDNPPYSIKKQIIATLVERNKPFMLLVPVSTMCYKYSQCLKGDLQILIPPRRIKFIKLENGVLKKDWKKSSAPFDCVWLCWKMNLERDIQHIKSATPCNSSV